MYSLILAVIYLAFISLGLPDSLLGSAWPVMHDALGVSVSYAGIVSMIISIGTVLSSLLSDRMTKRFSAQVVTAVSVAMTAAALFGFSVSKSFFVLCLWAIPYGFGAGAVDAALNNYVAIHYSSRHMNWLHCFWGVGCSISPYIMGFCLTKNFGWQSGYRTVSIIQTVIFAIIFLSLPLWKKQNKLDDVGEKTEEKPVKMIDAIKIRGVIFALTIFFAYCALEQTAGLWAATYLVDYCKINAETAATFASLFYLGITVGRFLSGFISDRLGDRKIITLGVSMTVFGIVLVALSFITGVLALVGLIIIGLGCAPIYPAMIHQTPISFGKNNSQAVIGMQMACAYVGTSFMPPLFGLIAGHISVALFPLYLLIFAALIFIMCASLKRAVDNK